MRTFEIPQTEIVIQPEIKESGTKVEYIGCFDDEGCVMATWNFAGKNYSSVTLWDEQTTPTYNEVNEEGITFEKIQERIIEIIKQ